MTEPTMSTAMNHESGLAPAGQQGKPTLGEMLSRNRLVQLLEIAVVFLPPLLVIVAFRMLSGDNALLFMGGVWVANILMIGLVWLGIKLRGDSWRSIGLTLAPAGVSGLGWAVLKSIPIFLFAIAGFILGSIVMANIVGIPGDANMNNLSYLQGNLPLLLISLLGVYIGSSFGEEVVYRGFLITRFEELLGGRQRAAVITAVMMSSLVFGLAHFAWGAMGIVQTTFMGAALGISFVLGKRRLWPLILAHGYMDTILLVQLYLTPEIVG